MLLSLSLHAQDRAFDIPAGDLKTAIDAYISATGQQVLYKASDLQGLTTKGVHGNMSAEQALSRLIEGSKVKVRKDSSGAMLITADDTKSESTLEAIYVFGKALSHLGDFARTGTRTDADPMTLPMSVSSVDKELLQQQQVNNLRDAVANVAGVGELNSMGIFTMRGFSAGIMRNGNITAGGLSFDAPLVSISKVEVVKGPEAIIAGTTAGYGGAINVISKTPEASNITELVGTVGSRGYYEAGFDVNRVVTDDKSLLVRFVASKQGSGTTWNGYDGNDKQYAAPSITWRNKSSGTELTAQYEYQKGHTAPDLEVFTDQPSLGRDLKMVRFGPVDSGKEKKNTILTLSASQKIHDGWDVSVKYSDDQTKQQTTSLLNGLGTAFGFPYPQVVSFNAFVDSRYTTKSSKVELKGSFETGPVEHHVVLAYDATTARVRSGAQYTAVTATNVQTGEISDLGSVFGPIFGGLPTPLNVVEVKTKETGLLAMDQIIFGKWVALAGFRQVRYEPDRNISPNAQTLNKGLPSLGIVYRATDNVSLYVNASKGFTPNTAMFDFAGKAIAPENADQVEGGIKVQFPRQKMAASFALFDIKQKNVAIPDPDHLQEICGISSCYISVPGVHSKGAEVEVSGEVYKGLGIRANYSYTTRANDELDVAGTAYAKHQGSVWAIYKFGDEFSGQGWWIGAGLQARSSRNKSPSPADVDNPGNLRWDTNGGYQAKNWSIVAGVKNLTDRRIYQLGSGIAGSGVVQQPREFYLTGRYNFN